MDIGNEDKSVILVDSKAATQKASNNANPDDASEPNDYDLLTKVIQGIDKQVGELEAKKDMIADAQIASLKDCFNTLLWLAREASEGTRTRATQSKVAIKIT